MRNAGDWRAGSGIGAREFEPERFFADEQEAVATRGDSLGGLQVGEVTGFAGHEFGRSGHAGDGEVAAPVEAVIGDGDITYVIVDAGLSAETALVTDHNGGGGRRNRCVGAVG